MAQLGYIKEIEDVKLHLQRLKDNGTIREWDLPYEQILTRVSAAYFFLTPVEGKEEQVWEEFKGYPHFQYGINKDKELSACSHQITFKEPEDEH